MAGLPIKTSGDMKSILWGKLLLNLNNALNALSDLPLAEELSDRSWRTAGHANGRSHGRHGCGQDQAGKTGRRAARLAASHSALAGLAVPAGSASRMLAVDPEARSSMWDDLIRGRVTEIDEFQGRDPAPCGAERHQGSTDTPHRRADPPSPECGGRIARPASRKDPALTGKIWGHAINASETPVCYVRLLGE